jgi:hypothetical protein
LANALSPIAFKELPNVTDWRGKPLKASCSILSNELGNDNVERFVPENAL